MQVSDTDSAVRVIEQIKIKFCLYTLFRKTHFLYIHKNSSPHYATYVVMAAFDVPGKHYRQNQRKYRTQNNNRRQSKFLTLFSITLQMLTNLTHRQLLEKIFYSKL